MTKLLEVQKLDAFYWRKKGRHASIVRFRIYSDLEHGSVTTILGANGAGKTTTLRAICRAVRTHGEIRLDGDPVMKTGLPKTWFGWASPTSPMAVALSRSLASKITCGPAHTPGGTKRRSLGH